MTISITLYPSIYDIDRHEALACTWEELVERFEDRVLVSKKTAAPGFGAHKLVPSLGAKPCPRHEGRIRTEPHRCGLSVEAVTLLVFDVDVGTWNAVRNTQARLEEACAKHLWYSSYSYTKKQAKPSLRLIIPPSEPIHPGDYEVVRDAVFAKFQIPAAKDKCSAPSHFWYVPSAETVLADCYFRSSPGDTLDVGSLDLMPLAVRPKKISLPTDFDWKPPREPDHPVDMAPFVERLKNLSNKFARGPVSKEKAELLRRLLAGTELGPHGTRNQVTFVTAGMVGYACSGMENATPGVLAQLFKRSVEAMQSGGSKLTLEKVETMLLGALRKKAEADALEEEAEEQRRKENSEIYDALAKPSAPSKHTEESLLAELYGKKAGAR